jgi:hypothetical protein
MLYKEIFVDYFENYMKPINTLCGQTSELLNVKAGISRLLCIYFWISKG